MSIRHLALYMVVAGLSIYAWKDWFKTLCGLILMMVIISLPPSVMPKTMLGIQGLNLWNVLFVMIVLAWAVNRRREGLTWDMPRHISVLLLMYLVVIVFGVLRAVFDRSHIENYPSYKLISEELINTVKWVLPGLLLFDGCRTRRRVIAAIICLFIMYFFFSALVIRCMPAEAAFSNSALMESKRMSIGENAGYAATDLSVMLGGASWGILAAMPLVHKKKYQLMVLAGAGVVTFGQALTGGRMGYAAWGATGLVLCLLKWRKYLILAPVVVMVLPVVFAGAAGRMLGGFGQIDVAGQSVTDDYAVTSGRTLIWPYVIDKIGESPWIGYGRLAMKRTGLQDKVMSDFGESFPHPHNMYLETLLDNGILGSIPILLFWPATAIYSARLFRSSNRLCSAVGGLALALVLTSLFAGVGGQHFYPQEHTLGIWAAIFLTFRVYVEEKKAQMGTATEEDYWIEPLLPEGRATVVSADISA